jgi:hypothetical protein
MPKTTTIYASWIEAHTWLTASGFTADPKKPAANNLWYYVCANKRTATIERRQLGSSVQFVVTISS